jgi:hypothetical protein
LVATGGTTPKIAPWRLPHSVRGKAPGRSTKLAVPHPVSRAETKEAMGRGGTPGGDVFPRQTVEADTDERRRHSPRAMRERRSMAAPTPTALNKCEAIDVDRHRRSRMGTRRRQRSPGVPKEPERRAAVRMELPKSLACGHTHGWLWAEPLVHGHPSSRAWGVPRGPSPSMVLARRRRRLFLEMRAGLGVELSPSDGATGIGKDIASTVRRGTSRYNGRVAGGASSTSELHVSSSSSQRRNLLLPAD